MKLAKILLYLRSLIIHFLPSLYIQICQVVLLELTRLQSMRLRQLIIIFRILISHIHILLTLQIQNLTLIFISNATSIMMYVIVYLMYHRINFQISKLSSKSILTVACIFKMYHYLKYLPCIRITITCIQERNIRTVQLLMFLSISSFLYCLIFHVDTMSKVEVSRKELIHIVVPIEYAIYVLIFLPRAGIEINSLKGSGYVVAVMIKETGKEEVQLELKRMFPKI